MVQTESGRITLQFRNALRCIPETVRAQNKRMKKLICYFLLISFLSACSTFHRMKSNKILASAELKSSSFYEVVPFEYISSLPVFEVTIQGENYRFIFDTGGYTVFSDKLTSRLSGIRKSSYIDVKDGNGTVSRIDTYELNQLEILTIVM